MRAQTIPNVSDRLRLSFPYDPTLVAAVKQIPGRKYLPADKVWTVPVTEEVFAFLDRHGAHCEPGVDQVRAALRGLDTQAQANRIPITTPPSGYSFQDPKPFAHQITGMNLLLDNETFGIFDEQGTGKTRLVVDTASYLFLAGKIGAVVVVCPNTVKGAWADSERGEIAKRTPEAVRYGVIRCDSDKYKQWGKDLATLKVGDAILIWVVINYEALRSGPIFAKIEALMKARPTLMVLDESSKVKSPRAEQTMAAQTLGQRAARRIIMTGTPITQRPLDLYAQFAFLDKRILGYPTFASFKARYARLGGYKVNGRPVEIIGYDHLDELERKIAGFSRRVLKQDCLDLPPKLYQVQQVPLSAEQWAAYKAMRDELLVEFGDGKDVAAPIVLTKLLRLTQITSGFLPVGDAADGARREIRYLPGAAKVEAILDLLDELPETEKVILWCQFHAEMAHLSERLADRKIAHVQVHGKVTGADRDEAVRRFQEDPAVRVFIGQEATGGIGITLTAASYVVYASNSYSWEHRAQSEDRAHRVGQTKSVTYVDLLATGPHGGMTIDHAVLEAVTQKRDLAALVLGDLRKTLGGGDETN